MRSKAPIEPVLNNIALKTQFLNHGIELVYVIFPIRLLVESENQQFWSLFWSTHNN